MLLFVLHLGHQHIARKPQHERPILHVNGRDRIQQRRKVGVILPQSILDLLPDLDDLGRGDGGSGRASRLGSDWRLRRGLGGRLRADLRRGRDERGLRGRLQRFGEGQLEREGRLPAAARVGRGFVEDSHHPQDGGGRERVRMFGHPFFNIPGRLDLRRVAHLDQHQPAQIVNHLASQRARIGAAVEGAVDLLETAPRIRVRDGGDEVEDGLGGRGPEDGLREVQRDAFARRGELVEQGDGVAHPARGLARDEGEGVAVGLNGFGGGDGLELADDLVHGDAAELVTLAAREDGGGDFVDLGGGEDEDGVRRRFFEGLEERVEGRRGEHVDFVNDVDFEFALCGGEIYFVAQVTDIVHRGVGGGVNFNEVEEAIFVDGAAVVAFVAGTLGLVVVQAVDGFRQQTRQRGLARAARTREEIGVRHAVSDNGVAEGLHDVLLADDFGPSLRAVFAVEGLGHGG
ncbi:MAG: hypothetical protein PGMFKBFP_01942 [Anaerolineales bacterium]|nr:hypothetical protein [Anaerolineales bacterium]